MSTKNNKSVVSQALMDMDAITSAIKEESKKSIKSLLSEAVRDALRESCEEDEEKDYEVEENEKNDANDKDENSKESTNSDMTEDVNDEMVDDTVEEPEMDDQEAPVDGEGEEEWEQFSQYQVGDDTYDLTGENDYENVVKVYKLLKDDDHVVVRQDGNKIQLKDETNDTEYVIDLGSDEDGESVEVDDSEDVDSINEGYFDNEFEGEEEYELDDLLTNSENQAETDIAGIADDFEDNDLEDEDFEIEIEDLDDENEELFESKKMKNNIKESKKTRKPMKESNEVLFEVDLGYTDNYQDKDPIAGLSNNEPSNSGKSWHKGVPTGTQKPWAGETKSKGEPFEKTVNEEEMSEIDIEEPVEENVGGAVKTRTTPKNNMPKGRKEYAPKTGRHNSFAGEYEEIVAESKRLKKENKALKEALLALKNNLNEAYVTNVNLGKITKLFLENTTSQSEKVDIVNRFSNEAKTIEQSKALYESIKRELNKDVTSKVNINETMGVANSNALNESTSYKSNDLLKTIDLMNRVMGC